MDCPNCHVGLEGVDVAGVHIDRCPNCQGTWFDKNELRVLRDRERNGDYHWIDVDLWRDLEKFRARDQQGRVCPKDGQPMTTVRYEDSNVAVDICSTCQGIWLEKGEYQRILDYLEETVDSSSSADYLKDLRHEFVEALEGRESPLGALQDVGKILYLLELRFTIEHPGLARLMNGFPRF
jgi:Zn-finger nucleic acid-binding protein